jgi:hypothetical protein
MSDPILIKNIGNKVVKVYVDQDASSPREFGMLSEILYSKKSRYTLGDRAVDSREIDQKIKNDEYICLPVFAYIHGNVTLSTKPFSCQWDSGQSGIIYVSKEKIRKEFGVKRVSLKLMETVIKQLQGEVNTYSRYLNGDVYGYVVEDDQGEEVDSCWGFFEEPTQIAEQVERELGI